MKEEGVEEEEEVHLCFPLETFTSQVGKTEHSWIFPRHQNIRMHLLY